MIDARAAIDPRAEIDENVSVGPFSVVGPDVQIGAGTKIGAHVVIEGPTVLGRDNRVHPFASLGGEPQDKKYRGEPSRLEIGDGNTIREYCTLNRGTADGGNVTRVGDDNWIMAYVHIAHDAKIGNHTIFANAASLAGHTEVGDFAILGGFTLLHQFCRIGTHAFTSMGSVINRDVPPYITVAGSMATPRGINVEGLKRRDFDAPRIRVIKDAYRVLYKSGLRLQEAREKLGQLASDNPDIQTYVEFLACSERSIVR